MEYLTCQVTDLLITWSHEKLKNLNLHFNNIYDSQTSLGDDSRRGTPSTKSRERLTKWSRGHYLLNAFRAFVVILLITLSLLSVVLRFLDDQTILILPYLMIQNF